MIAFNCFSGDTQNGCLLVFAETRNKAKALAAMSLYEWEYKDINSRRMPEFDKYYEGFSVIEDNDSLPKGAPKFYTDVEPFGQVGF